MTGCTYPVTNKFASAAPPKPCGSTDGAIAVNVPYFNRQGKQIEQLQMLCNEHTADVVVWKYVKNIPRQPLLADEVQLLLDSGFSENELMAEGLMLRPEEVVDAIDESETVLRDA